MPRTYNNHNPDFPVQAITVSEKLGEDPTVKLPDNFKLPEDSELELVSVGKNEFKVQVKKWGFCPNITALLTHLATNKLISDEFQKHVYNHEKSVYDQDKQKFENRRVYENPDQENRKFEAIIVQLHGTDYRAFFRYTEKQCDKLIEIGNANQFGFDPMPSLFEDYGVIFSSERKADLTVFQTIKRLQAAGLITEEFQKKILDNEHRIATQESRKKISDNFPTYSRALLHAFRKLEDLVTTATTTAPKITAGFFRNELPRPLRELSVEFAKFKDDDKGILERGLQRIMSITAKMGEKHPIHEAAKKCCNILVNIQEEDRSRLEL